MSIIQEKIQKVSKSVLGGKHESPDPQASSGSVVMEMATQPSGAGGTKSTRSKAGMKDIEKGPEGGRRDDSPHRSASPRGLASTSGSGPDPDPVAAGPADPADPGGRKTTLLRASRSVSSLGSTKGSEGGGFCKFILWGGGGLSFIAIIVGFVYRGAIFGAGKAQPPAGQRPAQAPEVPVLDLSRLEADEGAREPEAEPLNFFLWNPHWECFVLNQDGCAGKVVKQMRETLKDKHVDFAAGIMLEVESVQDLELATLGYSVTRHYCGKDVVDLIYDSRRWKAINEAKVGCMDMSSNRLDRPFVVQDFVRVGSNADSEPLAIIAAHFPHPDASQKSFENFEKTIADTVGKALKEVLAASPKLQRVALIADTNTKSQKPSSEIAKWVGMPAGPVEATELRRTCCRDHNFPDSMTFDRVIANFGTKIETQVWFDDGEVLPAWTCQKQPSGSGKCAAFHKPVLATLHLDGDVVQ